VWVTLTEEGRATMRSAPDALQDLFAAKFSSLPGWEQAMLVAALERIASLLNAEGIDASPLLHSTAIDR
jgi:DNA-binding MarR family transcriptional regulator